MNVVVQGIAVCAPGLPDWATAAQVLRGSAPFDPALVRDAAPTVLPPNERRRLPATARMAIGLGLEALQAAQADAAVTATVFASCGSDGTITHQICEALAASPVEVSPTRFHNSVHNAPAGYWSIALRTHAASTSLCAFEDSFAAGVLEAAAQVVTEGCPVLLVAYDLPYPQPLAELWTVPSAFGAALVLAPDTASDAPFSGGPGSAGGDGPVRTRSDEPLARLAIALEGAAQPSPWPSTLPLALTQHPAAASLRVLALLAGVGPDRVVLRCQAGTSVTVTRAR